MEFQSPPTSLTEDEQYAYEAFRQRLDFVNDLADAGQFLKFQWMHTEVSPVPLEIKFHILEGDPIKARAEFEARSVFLASQHSPEEGRTFKAYGRRYENTTQHFAELTFGTGTVKYVVVWMEKDVEPEPECDPKTAQHQLLVTGADYRMHGKCYCGVRLGFVAQGIDGQGLLEELFADHLKAVAQSA